ncbi:MAG: hypothetical protein V2B14_05985 [bacterium]
MKIGFNNIPRTMQNFGQKKEEKKFDEGKFLEDRQFAVMDMDRVAREENKPSELRQIMSGVAKESPAGLSDGGLTKGYIEGKKIDHKKLNIKA